MCQGHPETLHVLMGARHCDSVQAVLLGSVSTSEMCVHREEALLATQKLSQLQEDTDSGALAPPPAARTSSLADPGPSFLPPPFPSMPHSGHHLSSLPTRQSTGSPSPRIQSIPVVACVTGARNSGKELKAPSRPVGGGDIREGGHPFVNSGLSAGTT